MAATGETAIGTNHELAEKVFSASLHADSVRRSSFLRMLSESTSTQRMATAKRQKTQSSPSMPIVIVNDLTKAAGDRVSCDLYHILSGKPTMGDRVIEGRGDPLELSTMEVIINQSRKAVKPGGRMTQKRTSWNLRTLARSNLSEYFSRLMDQRLHVQLAGARGSQMNQDWTLPLESDDDFEDILINPVMPPTSNRYFVANGGTQVSDISSSDALTLEDLDIIGTKLREMPFPPAPIETRMTGETDNDPVWCLLVTERQWHYIVTRAKTTGTWRQAVTDALTRSTMEKHPLFTGECGLWNNILIKRTGRSIRFNAGDTVRTTSDTDLSLSSSTVAAGLTVDRAILLGGQALALAYGNGSTSMLGAYPTTWSEKLLDHDNSVEIAAGNILGPKKFRFKQSDGRWTDFGAAVIDSYAPDPDTAAGTALRNALQS